jgi:hypothetical protein
MDGLIGKKSRIYGFTDSVRMRDHYKIARRPESPFTDTGYSSTGVSTVLTAPIVWCFGFLSPFQPYILCRVYADLPTVLTIVHCDGTHPIPPH